MGRDIRSHALNATESDIALSSSVLAQPHRRPGRPVSHTLMMDDIDRVHELWDELADFGASRCDEALVHLMQALQQRLQSDNVTWVGALRLDEGPIESSAGAGNWQAVVSRHLCPSSAPDTLAWLETRGNGLSSSRDPGIGGAFGVGHPHGLAASDWLKLPNPRQCRILEGDNTLWAAFPVSDIAVSWFGVFRQPDQRPFCGDDSDWLARVLRGILWFHRQLMLSHGLLQAASPLTPTERKLLHLFLTGLPEKLIAERLERSQHTVHDTITSIYRKFGVKNRASLMAIWLGRAI